MGISAANKTFAFLVVLDHSEAGNQIVFQQGQALVRMIFWSLSAQISQKVDWNLFQVWPHLRFFPVLQVDGDDEKDGEDADEDSGYSDVSVGGKTINRLGQRLPTGLAAVVRLASIFLIFEEIMYKKGLSSK